MKILDDLKYQAGGYSTDDLINASHVERRQIRHLGRASLISILASNVSWGFAATLIFPAGDPLKLYAILFAVMIITSSVIFTVNRTYYYHSDTSRKDKPDLLLPLFRIMLMLFSTVLCFIAVATKQPYWMVLPFILATLELFPLLLKARIGSTVTGVRERARLEREYKHEIDGKRVDKVVDKPRPVKICPQRINFDAEKCKVQIKDNSIGCISCPHFENVRAMR